MRWMRLSELLTLLGRAGSAHAYYGYTVVITSGNTFRATELCILDKQIMSLSVEVSLQLLLHILYKDASFTFDFAAFDMLLHA